MFRSHLRAAALWAFAAATSFQASAQSPIIPPEKWEDLGFAQAGTDVRVDEYVQLRMAVYVTGESDTFVLDKCPASNLWDFDLKGIFKGNSNVQLGVQVTAPAIPVNVFMPLKVDRKSAGWKKSCSVTLDLIRYRSPLYFVRMYPNALVTIKPTYTASQQLDPSVQTALKKLASKVIEASGIPAATASVVLEPLSDGIPATPVTQEVQIIRNLVIEAGKVKRPVEWVIPGDVLSVSKKGPRRTVVLAAQLVPIPYIISPPEMGSAWQPGVILSSAYPVPAAGNPGQATLGSYLSTVAGKEMQEYALADTPSAANARCDALADKVHGLGMSDRDASLALWALTRDRLERGKSSAGEIDNMSCLNGSWDALAKANITRTPMIPPALPGVPPVRNQMRMTVELDDSAQAFFTSSSWEQRRRMAPVLFQYPVTYIDPAGLVMRSSTTIESSDSWLVNAHDRTGESKVLAKIGCYTYFDGTKSHPFAQFPGRSVVLGFGETAASGERPSREVAVLMSFVPVSEGKEPRIDTVTIQDSISNEVRAESLAVLDGAPQCRSGYAPKLLFGG